MSISNETPEGAADHLLRTIGRIRAINYAMVCAGGTTIRGESFWTTTLDIVRRADWPGAYAGTWGARRGADAEVSALWASSVLEDTQ